LHRWATAFWYPVSQSGTEAFQYRTGSPASDGLGYTLYVNIVGGEKEYAVHPACPYCWRGKKSTLHVHTTGGGKGYILHVNAAGGGQGHTLRVHSACSRKGYTMHVHTAGGGKDTPCTFILLAVKSGTPGMSILLRWKGIHPLRPYF
jgi:hypothetical protein